MKKYEYIFCTLSFIILISLIEFNKWKDLNEFNDNFILTETINEIEEPQEEFVYKEEITSLKEQYNNDDVVGTIEILNTDYKVPIVQGKDNDYYLDHLPNKEYSIMGSIFLDYRVNIDTSRKILVYGHNSSKFEMPFDILENYYDETYLNEHKYIEIKTKNKIRKYEVFSVFVEPTDYSYMKVKFEGNEYLEHLEKLKNKSFFDIDTKLSNDTNILILQTCSTHKDYLKYKKKYLIIVLKEIENISNENSLIK